MPNDESSKALALAPAHSRGCRDGSAIDWIRDAAVVERIIAAVRTVVRKTEFEKEWELNLDRNWLVSDLLDAGTKWRLFTALDSDKGARERAKLFSAISDKAKDFKECLLNNTDQRYAARQIASTFSNASDFERSPARLLVDGGGCLTMTSIAIIRKMKTAPMASRGGTIRLVSAFPAGGRNNARHFRYDFSNTDFHK